MRSAVKLFFPSILQSQVLVGLALTHEGLPITHFVYPGNTSDQLIFLPDPARG